MIWTTYQIRPSSRMDGVWFYI